MLNKLLLTISVLFSTAYMNAFAGVPVPPGTGFETESNNVFAERNIFNSGTTLVQGELEPAVLLGNVYEFLDNFLEPGRVLNFETPSGDFDPGTSFFAYTDNFISGVDTVLGSFDSSNTVLAAINDDGGPMSDNFGSGLTVTVNNQGFLHLQVSGIGETGVAGDPGFLGNHNRQGSFDLIVTSDKSVGDVDFLSFAGLNPGDNFFAEIVAADFDTALGVFDESGNLIEFDDDGGNGLLSLLTGVVPESGVVNLAVSGYPDEVAFLGAHFEDGLYELAFDSSPVPLPPAALLFASGLIGLLVSRRKLAAS
jgi:hypothetical protein